MCTTCTKAVLALQMNTEVDSLVQYVKQRALLLSLDTASEIRESTCTNRQLWKAQSVQGPYDIAQSGRSDH